MQLWIQMAFLQVGQRPFAKAAVGRQEEQKRWPQGVERACLGWGWR